MNEKEKSTLEIRKSMCKKQCEKMIKNNIMVGLIIKGNRIFIS